MGRRLSVFVDTSGLVAVLNQADQNHSRAAAELRRLIELDEELVTHNYVALETAALVQHRLGMPASRSLHERILPALTMTWVDAALHQSAVEAVLADDRRKVSLVDHVSFQLMRTLGIRSVLGFDRHFDESGFASLSSPL